MQNNGHQRRNNPQRDILRGLIDRGDESALFIGKPLHAQTAVGGEGWGFNRPHHQAQNNQRYQRAGEHIDGALEHGDDRPAN